MCVIFVGTHDFFHVAFRSTQRAWGAGRLQPSERILGDPCFLRWYCPKFPKRVCPSDPRSMRASCPTGPHDSCRRLLPVKPNRSFLFCQILRICRCASAWACRHKELTWNTLSVAGGNEAGTAARTQRACLLFCCVRRFFLYFVWS